MKSINRLSARSLKSKVLTLLSLRGGARRLKVYPDDVFIVSYPRSGNTWARALVGGLVFRVDINAENVKSLLPDIYRASRSELESIARPRYLKSHEPYLASYPKVLYVVRDPRDVVISYHKWRLAYQRTTSSFDEFVMDFIQGQTQYGGWGDHVAGWLQNAPFVPHGFLLVRYEDLLASTLEKTAEIAKFLGISASNAFLEQVVTQSRFEAMQAKERKAKESKGEAVAASGYVQIRAGQTQQWKSLLSREQLKLFASKFGPVASQLGYDLTEGLS
jgi:hypothetical protein